MNISVRPVNRIRVRKEGQDWLLQTTEEARILFSKKLSALFRGHNDGVPLTLIAAEDDGSDQFSMDRLEIKGYAPSREGNIDYAKLETFYNDGRQCTAVSSFQRSQQHCDEMSAGFVTTGRARIIGLLLSAIDGDKPDIVRQLHLSEARSTSVLMLHWGNRGEPQVCVPVYSTEHIATIAGVLSRDDWDRSISIILRVPNVLAEHQTPLLRALNSSIWNIHLPSLTDSAVARSKQQFEVVSFYKPAATQVAHQLKSDVISCDLDGLVSIASGLAWGSMEDSTLDASVKRLAIRARPF